MIFYLEKCFDDAIPLCSSWASPARIFANLLQLFLQHYNLDMTPTKDTYISLTLFSSLSCFDCLRAVQCTTTQGNRERVQHSKLIDFYITEAPSEHSKGLGLLTLKDITDTSTVTPEGYQPSQDME